jgi:hypothetical protein
MTWPKNEMVILNTGSGHVKAIMHYPGGGEFWVRTGTDGYYLTYLSCPADTTLAVMNLAAAKKFPIHTLWSGIVECHGNLVFESLARAYYLYRGVPHWFNPEAWFAFVEGVRDVIEMNTEEEET